MNKGLSAWLFSKMVMLAFLIIIFTIMNGFLIILTERAYADSAAVLTLQLKEAASGVANSNVIEIQKVIPIPKVLPSDKSTNSRQYYIVIKKQGSGNNQAISFAVSKDLISDDVFVSASLIYTDEGTNLGTSVLKASSDVYRYIVIQKKLNNINFYACKKTSSTGFSGCISGTNSNQLSITS